LVLDTTRMTGVLTHQPHESTATVRAGSRLDVLAERFATTGQRLALDPPGTSTVGGTVATSTSGPLRMSHGGVADLLLAATLVRGDGTVLRGPASAGSFATAESSASAGSEVPEHDALEHTVPEHTMVDLFSGGFGALGVVTEVTFQLHARPPVRRWLVREVAHPAEVRALTAPLLTIDPAPSAIEVYSPCGPDQIAVLVEGTAEEVADRLPALVTALGSGYRNGDLDGNGSAASGPVSNGSGQPGDPTDVVSVSEQPPAWWSRYPFETGDVALRITTPPCEIFSAGYIVRDGAGGAPVRTRWSPGVAVMYAALPCDTDPARVARMIEGVRQTLIARRGSCVVLHAPAAVRERVDMWGPVTEPDLWRQLKDRYDPYGLLAPGRFPLS
ncbi:MAG: FAD-binding oxidoreductase, partial [Micromonosporaceae bacterium]